MGEHEIRPTWRALAEQAIGDGLDEAALFPLSPHVRGLAVQLIADRIKVLPATLPDPNGGCACQWYSEDRGGGHFETMLEYEPACPEHSEHLYDPKAGMWVQDASKAAQATVQALQRYVSDVEEVMRHAEAALGSQHRSIELYRDAVKRMQADLQTVGKGAVDMSR